MSARTKDRLPASLVHDPHPFTRPVGYGGIRNGRAVLDQVSQSFEAAQVLLRLFRALDALTGSDDGAARRWLATRNADLDARPLDLIDGFRGLIAVCDYVDAHRVHA